MFADNYEFPKVETSGTTRRHSREQHTFLSRLPQSVLQTKTDDPSTPDYLC